MDHTRGDGQVVFASHAWRRLFGIRGPLVRELILEFFSTCRIAQAYWDESSRMITSKADLRGYWDEISSSRDFLTTVPFYTHIRDPLRRLCHHLIAFTIARRAQYLFRYAEGSKQGARMSKGHFITRLAEHFGLITEESIRGLTVVVHDLTMIDMDELVRLHICERVAGIQNGSTRPIEQQLGVAVEYRSVGTQGTLLREQVGNNSGKNDGNLPTNATGKANMSKQCNKNQRGNGIIRGLKIKCCWFKLKLCRLPGTGFQNPFYLKKSQQLQPMLYVGDLIQKTNPIVILDSEETLTLAEESRSKMLLKHKDNMMQEKIKQINTTPIDYAALNQLYKDFETRFVPQTELSAEQAS
ncbi:hypothetical protein Tco_0707247 [Tanacetum coccineum]|uniref:Uncharacterized protein n=1 Tax=Tanacetum coccineum TaxID=301880 RepID=A0ABQ4YAS2_9ASTR